MHGAAVLSMADRGQPLMPDAAAVAAARALLGRHVLLDGHNDLPWALREADAADLATADLSRPVSFTQTDLPRIAAGGVGAQFWSVYVPADAAG